MLVAGVSPTSGTRRDAFLSPPGTQFLEMNLNRPLSVCLLEAPPQLPLCPAPLRLLQDRAPEPPLTCARESGARPGHSAPGCGLRRPQG